MSPKKFWKILIANRGEIALRGIKACRKLGIKTVAIYSEVDGDCLHVKKAGEAVRLKGNYGHAYKDIEQIIQIAKDKSCDAIFPGYGFASEEESFALACEENGIIFIGPKSDSIRKMGNKSEARIIAKREGVPISRGTGRVIRLEDALDEIKSLSYPLKIMADRGGGGLGTKVAYSESELEAKFLPAQQEGLSYGGDPNVSIVEFIPDIRHIEVQILGDGRGNVIHLGTRDCSVQRRWQKLIEETPARNLSKELIRAMQNDAVKLAKAVNYRGAGTVEFMVFGNQYVFGEMNTRIQVEHPITEMITGVDIVKEMILVAFGSLLRYRQEDISFNGHSLECRINAEDPDKNFMPDPGIITAYHPPRGFRVRVDSHLYKGYEVPYHYDSLVAKLIVWGKTREITIRRMIRALSKFKIEGIKTTIPFHLKILESLEFRSGKYSTNLLENMQIKRPTLLPQENPEVADVLSSPLLGVHGCFDDCDNYLMSPNEPYNKPLEI